MCVCVCVCVYVCVCACVCVCVVCVCMCLCVSVHVFLLFNKKRSRERYCSEQIKIQVLSPKIALFGRNSYLKNFCSLFHVPFLLSHAYYNHIIIAQGLSVLTFGKNLTKSGI